MLGGDVVRSTIELPRDRPATDRPLTDRELLALPNRPPPREAFGDRYFSQLVFLLKLGLGLVHWLLKL